MSLLDRLDEIEMETSVREGRQPRLAFRDEHHQQIADEMERLGVLPAHREECAQAIRSSSFVTQSGQIEDDLRTGLSDIIQHVVSQKEQQNVLWAAPTSPALRKHITRDVKTFGDLHDSPRYSKLTLQIALVRDRGLDAFSELHREWLKPENAPAREALANKQAERERQARLSEIKNLRDAHAAKLKADR